jgi:APA family basic amino acid/polyamine antiporter
VAGGQLERAIGITGAMLMGLGSILGTGIFISVGIATQIAGPAVLVAIALALVLALCNGLSSAQLAASHPVSGGTYEYGYHYLKPSLGFAAGWTFLLAKSASAATAALGFAKYITPSPARVPLAMGLVAAITALVAGGIRRSNRMNAAIVAVTLLGLLLFVLVNAPRIEPAHFAMTFDAHDIAQATALVFVAFTGYGRIATLGEEVHNPTHTIPRAIILALAGTAVLYVSVVGVAIGVFGAEAFGTSPAPLELASNTRVFIEIAGLTAMAGVLLNIVLGLSRVLLAMGRRGDMPATLAVVHERTKSPRHAVIFTGFVIIGLVALHDVKTTWSFSAFSVLLYYAITNLAALRMPREHRRFPRAFAVVGVVACLALAFCVPPIIWLIGLGALSVGLVWHFAIAHRWRTSNPEPQPPDSEDD